MMKRNTKRNLEVKKKETQGRAASTGPPNKPPIKKENPLKKELNNPKV